MNSFIITAILVAIIALSNSAPIEEHGHEAYAKPQYQFKYGVHDAHTGDIKEQWEHRDGDNVKGSYSLAEADGTHRQVDYTSDSHSGFNAVVKKTGKAVHPQVVYSHGHGSILH